MNKPNAQTIALALLAAGEVSHAYSSFLPSFFTIKALALQGSQADVATKLASLRSGYVPATAFGVGLAAVISIIAENPLPLIMGATAAGVMMTMYEQALPAATRLDPLSALVAGLAAAQTVPALTPATTGWQPVARWP